MINHTGFVVSDLERSVAFYQLFGAQRLAEDDVVGAKAEQGLRSKSVEADP